LRERARCSETRGEILVRSRTLPQTTPDSGSHVWYTTRFLKPQSYPGRIALGLGVRFRLRSDRFRDIRTILVQRVGWTRLVQTKSPNNEASKFKADRSCRNSSTRELGCEMASSPMQICGRMYQGPRRRWGRTRGARLSALRICRGDE
jgi:hypothetical protein